MLNQFFKNKFKFTYDYFSTLLDFVSKNERKFPQAIIFEGADTKAQYLFALELARILNCIGNKSSSCECINCKWIKSHSHPAINNVSQIHFKGEDDETKTVISVKQAREIEKNLTLSSDFHRFFIFFSSSEKTYEEGELVDFEKLNYNSNINFSIQPLTYKTFNALLKSIEEPPEKTTFIFLTKSREDILPTIVSRCLVFKLSGFRENLNYNDILNLISIYPNIDYKTALDIASNIQTFSKENGIEIELILNKTLEYLKDLLKQNLNNTQLIQKIKNDINFTNTAIKQLKANVSEKNVLETLLLKIARGY